MITDDSKPIHNPFQGQATSLTEEQIEYIAEKAAEVALAKVYMQIGKSVVNRVLWAIGVGALALLVWASGYGSIK